MASPQQQEPKPQIDNPSLPTLNEHPALGPSTTNVPVTPDIALTAEKSTYFSDSGSSDPSWNTGSAFAPDDAPSSPQSSVAEAIAGARSPRELLRRMSLIDGVRSRSDFADVDPKTAYPALNLSGHVISAAFCVPHTIYYKSGADWDLQERRGTSALYDSFSYLASDATPWHHTLVGWTGEFKQALDVSSTSPSEHPNSTNRTPLNSASAPVPVDGTPKPQPGQHDGLRLTREDRAKLERQLAHDEGGRVVPVWLADSIDEDEDVATFKDQGRWRRYAEHQLYTLFHYRQQDPTHGSADRERQWWDDYYRMNRAFADRILEIYKPGDVVWIHDYHLLLLPNMLRQRVPNVYIGFYLHIPFPSSEFLRCLSRRKEVLVGMLGANMIGVQSYSYSRHFASCCTRVLGFDSDISGVDAYGAHVAVDVFPIGIDAAAAQRTAFGDPVIDEKIDGIRDLYAGRRIIVGRDRLDSIRGVVQKLQAFEIFLERYPEWRNKVVLIQVTSPSSVVEEKDDESNKIRNKIGDLVDRINGTYGSLSYAPVQHYPQYLSKEEYFALLRIANIALITSTRDGMNTTSLEYVVCQRFNHGPLILSEFSGTAASMGNAIHINPWDLGGVAEAINYALGMSEGDRGSQHAKLYKQVTTNTVQMWTNNYLRRLMTNLASFRQSIATPALDRIKLLEKYKAAKKRLFMFDYDGTLTPIVKDPAAAIPSDRVVRTLKTLAADPRNAVWIISGRDQAFLDEYLGHISELGFSAEHGSFVRQPRSDQWENLTAKMDMGWQKDVLEIFIHYTEKTQGSFIERKKIALTWHYRRADPEYGAFQARECQKHLESTVAKQWDVEVMPGKANLEVRPTFVNKGAIAKQLVESYGHKPGEGPDFVLCLGDDFTDEDMFRSLNNSKTLDPDCVFAVTVGASSKQTLAGWHLLEPADVIQTIGMLNGSDDAVVDGGSTGKEEVTAKM